MPSQNLLSDQFDFSGQQFHPRTCGCGTCGLNAGGSQQFGSTDSGQYVTTAGLTSATFGDHTQNAVNVYGESLKYFIYDQVGSIDFEDNTSGTSLGHTSSDANFVRSVFSRLDSFVDLDFSESATWSGTTFDVYCLSSYSGWGSSTVGSVNDQGSGSGSYWDVMWKKTNSGSLSDFDAVTVVHEIGHALGLSHPFEDPSNGLWNTDDTIMSYNIGPDGWNTWFSDIDIATMIKIWGVEDDNGNGYDGTSGRDVVRGSTKHEIFAGYSGDDEIRGLRGKDTLFGYDGVDELRAGNGRDYIWGGKGGDEMYGGFGHNTFGDERDGSADDIYFKSDQFAYNYIYDSAGNSPNGEKVDILKGLETIDRIYMQGVTTSSLSFQSINNFSTPSGVFSGIGIYTNGYLEAIYTGGDLTAAQVQSITSGVAV